MPSMPASSRGSGAGSPSLNGSGLGPTAVQPPASGVLRRAPPSHGGSQLAFRPAWASWMPATAPVGVDEAGDPGQRLHVPVVPDAQVGGGAAAVARHGGRLHDHQGHAADRPAAEVDEVPVVGQPLLGAVLAHRRHDDPVAEGDPPDRQRAEQVRLGHFPVVVRRGGAAVGRTKGVRSVLVSRRRHMSLLGEEAAACRGHGDTASRRARVEPPPPRRVPLISRQAPAASSKDRSRAAWS